jgi:drug/metabolite transporter (DMT)-like permease
MEQRNAGLVLLLGFVAAQAVRDVYLRHLFGSLGLFEVALIAFGTAAGVFGLGVLLFGRHQLRLLRNAWRQVIAVNVTTVVAWLSYFGSLRLVEPAAVNLAFSGIAPAAVAVWSLFGLKSATSSKAGRVERCLHWALMGVVGLLALIVSTGRSGFPRLDPATGLAGIALAVFSGIVITAETIVSKRMNEVGISALSIVGVRFSLVTAVAALMVARAPTSIIGHLSATAITVQSLVFLFVLVGPIYLGQAGLKLTNPLLSSVVSAIGPITTLALQATVGLVGLSPAMLMVTALYAIVSVTAAVVGAIDSREPGRIVALGERSAE